MSFYEYFTNIYGIVMSEKQTEMIVFNRIVFTRKNARPYSLIHSSVKYFGKKIFRKMRRVLREKQVNILSKLCATPSPTGTEG